MGEDFSKAELPSDIRSGVSRVGRKISSFGTSIFRSGSLYQPAMHLLRNNGKYMRPTLVLMGAHIMGKKVEDFVDIATAAELLHVSSLIHDDMIDGDRKRRGVDSVHIKYGKERAILAGDALISKAIGLSARYGYDVMSLISDATMDMCAGETIDYDCQSKRKIPSLAEYQSIARLKSASLIAACCSIAAVHAKNKAAARKLYSFGEKIGIAFQMRDDIMDFTGAVKISSDGYRPNIVSTLIRHLGLSKGSALKRASELNNRYVDSAVRSVEGVRGAGPILGYAKMIRVR